MPASKAIGGSYRFRYPSYGKPDGYPAYTAHSGQIVTILRKLTPAESSNIMYEIQAADGWKGNACADELRKQAARRRDPHRRLAATHTFAFAQGANARGVPVTAFDGRILFITLHRGGKVGRIWELDAASSSTWVKPIKSPTP